MDDLVGRRIELYVPESDSWSSAVVISTVPQIGRICIEFADGSRRLISRDRQVFRVIAPLPTASSPPSLSQAQFANDAAGGDLYTGSDVDVEALKREQAEQQAWLKTLDRDNERLTPMPSGILATYASDDEGEALGILSRNQGDRVNGSASADAPRSPLIQAASHLSKDRLSPLRPSSPTFLPPLSSAASTAVSMGTSPGGFPGASPSSPTIPSPSRQRIITSSTGPLHSSHHLTSAGFHPPSAHDEKGAGDGGYVRSSEAADVLSAFVKESINAATAAVTETVTAPATKSRGGEGGPSMMHHYNSLSPSSSIASQQRRGGDAARPLLPVQDVGGNFVGAFSVKVLEGRGMRYLCAAASRAREERRKKESLMYQLDVGWDETGGKSSSSGSTRGLSKEEKRQGGILRGGYDAGISQRRYSSRVFVRVSALQPPSSRRQSAETHFLSLSLCRPISLFCTRALASVDADSLWSKDPADRLLCVPTGGGGAAQEWGQNGLGGSRVVSASSPARGSRSRGEEGDGGGAVSNGLSRWSPTWQVDEGGWICALLPHAVATAMQKSSRAASRASDPLSSMFAASVVSGGDEIIDGGSTRAPHSYTPSPSTTPLPPSSSSISQEHSMASSTASAVLLLSSPLMKHAAAAALSGAASASAPPTNASSARPVATASPSSSILKAQLDWNFIFRGFLLFEVIELEIDEEPPNGAESGAPRGAQQKEERKFPKEAIISQSVFRLCDLFAGALSSDEGKPSDESSRPFPSPALCLRNVLKKAGRGITISDGSEFRMAQEFSLRVRLPLQPKGSEGSAGPLSTATFLHQSGVEAATPDLLVALNLVLPPDLHVPDQLLAVDEDYRHGVSSIGGGDTASPLAGGVTDRLTMPPSSTSIASAGRFLQYAQSHTSAASASYHEAAAAAHLQVGPEHWRRQPPPDSIQQQQQQRCSVIPGSGASRPSTSPRAALSQERAPLRLTTSYLTRPNAPSPTPSSTSSLPPAGRMGAFANIAPPLSQNPSLTMAMHASPLRRRASTVGPSSSHLEQSYTHAAPASLPPMHGGLQQQQQKSHPYFRWLRMVAEDEKRRRPKSVNRDNSAAAVERGSGLTENGMMMNSTSLSEYLPPSQSNEDCSNPPLPTFGTPLQAVGAKGLPADVSAFDIPALKRHVSALETANLEGERQLQSERINLAKSLRVLSSLRAAEKDLEGGSSRILTIAKGRLGEAMALNAAATLASTSSSRAASGVASASTEAAYATRDMLDHVEPTMQNLKERARRSQRKLQDLVASISKHPYSDLSSPPPRKGSRGVGGVESPPLSNEIDLEEGRLRMLVASLKGQVRALTDRIAREDALHSSF